MAQLTYTEEKDRWIPGQLTRASDARRIMTRVNAQVGQPQIVDTVFALTWAPNDDITSTIAGIAVATTNIVGATPEAARNEHLATLQANAAVAEFGSFAAVSTDTIRFTSKEVVEGSGKYYDVEYSVVEATAGDGTATETETQARINAGDLKFGLGVIHDSTDTERGMRALLPSATGQRFAGVVQHGHAFDNRGLNEADGVPQSDPFGGVMQGYIAVRVDSDVVAAMAPGLPAFLRHTASGLGTPGQFRHDADTANADAIPAVFTGKTQTTDGVHLAELFVNSP
jgi:hypothetical protein